MVDRDYTVDHLDAWLLNAGVGPDDKVAVAVSGGADSLALAFLAAACRPTLAITVDHCLRPDSGAEAETVTSMLADQNIAHQIVRWSGAKPTGNIQAVARRERYRLLTDVCREQGISFLLTGHHMDDQAETLILRLARGSGLYGLAGMPAVTPDYAGTGIALLRPFLRTRKEQLIAFLQRHDLDWIEDPSNENKAFDRVKVRQFLKEPPLEGLDILRLSETADRLRRSRQAITFYVNQWLDTYARMEPQHYVSIPSEALNSAPDEIVLRGIIAILHAVADAEYAPRFEKLERLYAAMRDIDFAGVTLAGCKIEPLGDGFLFAREPSAISPATPLGDGVWDNRFVVSAQTNSVADLVIMPLADDLWGQARAQWPDLKDIMVPTVVRRGLPVVCRLAENGDAEVVELPTLGKCSTGTPIVTLSCLSNAIPKK
ncbi:tRNA(Ile)-lysidine synthase [Kordiimonas sediminis]|uniref:tRNA(Ile)-lysidine synthase n=1 Tax=Kordiimonas sediminis TaxID=1735581 RepID=A0A919E7W5_9PROT|nr:tRNA lysidine(34) synthetase TilS [Kordiimonas sediminis]GHF23327.1 tRNA(Ile)-lysidine synthase [Kordiimonas sediminis]